MQAAVASSMAAPVAAAVDPSQQAAMMAMMGAADFPDVTAMLQQAGAASAAQIPAPAPGENGNA